MKCLIQAITTDKNLSVVGRTCWNRQQYDYWLYPQSDHPPIVWWFIYVNSDIQSKKICWFSNNAMLCCFLYFLTWNICLKYLQVVGLVLMELSKSESFQSLKMIFVLKISYLSKGICLHLLKPQEEYHNFQKQNISEEPLLSSNH